MAGAALAVEEGRTRAALRLAGAAESLSRRSGNYLHEVEQSMHPLPPLLDRARREVGTAIADRLMAEGARMTVDALVAEATAEPGSDQGDLLSTREREVVELVAQGRTNVAIARELFISKRTVESHLDHVKQKLGLTAREQIIAWALREGGQSTTAP
jgi:DNA-binding NarL/FixJ family response regulator